MLSDLAGVGSDSSQELVHLYPQRARYAHDFGRSRQHYLARPLGFLRYCRHMAHREGGGFVLPHNALQACRNFTGRSPCWPTAVAIAAAIAVRLAMASPTPLTALHASSVARWIAAICGLTCSVARAVCAANCLTSDATTANPLPASPVRPPRLSHSGASRLVWLAISAINPTTAPTWPAACSDRAPFHPRLRPGYRLLVACVPWPLAGDLSHTGAEFLGRGGNRGNSAGALLGPGVVEALPERVCSTVCATASAGGRSHRCCGDPERGQHARHRGAEILCMPLHRS